MKVLILLGLFSQGFAYNATGDYIQLRFKAPAVIGTDGAVTDCHVAPKQIILIKPARYGASTFAHGGLQGACLNYKKAAESLIDLQSAVDESGFFYYNTTTTGKFHWTNFAKPGCQEVLAGTVNQATREAANASGFTFGSTSGTTVCGGLFADANKGLNFDTTTAANGLTVAGTIHFGKRHLAMQISGPFTDTNCSQGATSADTQHGGVPVIVPLEASAAVAPHTPAHDIAAVTATGQCSNYKNSLAATPGGLSILKVRTTATAAELIIEYGIGTDSDMTSCTIGTGAAASMWRLKYTVQATGNFTDGKTCIQAVNKDDAAISSAYYKMDINPESFGDWVSHPAIPSVVPTACPSPAANLHVSVAMAFALALMAMMM